MNRKAAVLNLHQILVKRRDVLRRAIESDLNSLKALRPEGSGDTADAAIDANHDDIKLRLAEVEQRELGRIEAALAMMREGTYGVCERCTITIPMARLNALPYASLCIACQRKTE